MTYSVEALCWAHGISRQAYYQQRRRDQVRQEQEAQLLQRVDEIRAALPRLGTRKLYHLLQEELSIGRDKFFDLLRRNGRLVQPRKRRWPRTTDAGHGFRYWKNLTWDFTPSAPNQLWVSDITYLETLDGFCYASLVTDAYSRKIVGFHLSCSLSVEGSLEALKMALGEAGQVAGLIHHSDRGVQYCCHAYTALLHTHQVRISMTEVDHCYENALAERVNGILKQEFYLDAIFQDQGQARDALSEAVGLYNERRPHLSLLYQTPAMKHAV